MSRGAFDERRVVTRYDIGTSTIYVGQADYVDHITAPAESDTVWTIRKITLVSGSPTKSEWTNPGSTSWTARAAGTYA